MWQEIVLAEEELEHLSDVEKRIGGRIMDIRTLGDGNALVRYAPIVNDSWFLEIMGGEPRLCFVDEYGFIMYVDEAFDVSPEDIARIIERVMKDYGITHEDSGQFYPIHPETDAAFQALIKQARRVWVPGTRRSPAVQKVKPR